MNPTRQYPPNSGNFRKGLTPWNKGKKMGGRADAVKGRQGFPAREVVAINPDGTVRRRFKSVEAARSALGLADRHSITHACQGKYLCRGLKLLYAEDYVPWADYSYRRRRFRDIYGRLLPGHHNAGLKQPSGERRKEMAERARERSFRMAHDPSSNWGKARGLKPIVCLETGERFPSYRAACEKLGLESNQVSQAIARKGKCHGYTFRKEESLTHGATGDDHQPEAGAY